MATPIGHSLAGFAVTGVLPQRAALRSLIPVVLMANAADLDFLPGIFVGMPALYHHGLSHSLGAAAIVSLLGALVMSRFGVAPRAGFAVCFLAYASHLVLDLFAPDARPPFGIPLFWPLSDSYVAAPVTVLPGVHHAGRTDASVMEWVLGILVARNVGAIGIEVALFAPLAWLAARRALRRPDAGPRSAEG